MRKNILLIIIALFSANLSLAQFICNISPEVKEAGEVMTKGKGNSNDASIIGDYREQGTGWVLLPDHTGAVFIKNLQISELIWGLDNNNGNLALAVMFLKNELDENGKIQPESQNLFLVNIKSDTIIELLNNQTFQTLKQIRTKLIPGKVYSQIKNNEVVRKKAEEPFSAFAKRYLDSQIVIWQEKGEFEKTSDWQVRVNEDSRKQKLVDFMEEAIGAYAKSLHIRLGFCYIGASLELGSYDADKEIYIIKSRDFGGLSVPVPLNEATEFKDKDWCGNSSDPTDVIFFIENDELNLAQATFWNKYKYINPAARNRIKTKKEIAHEQKQQAENFYNAKDYKQTIACYQKVITMNPDIMEAFNYKDLGNSSFLTEDYSQVIKSYKKALEIDKHGIEDDSVYYQLGISYQKLKNFSNAIMAYKDSFRFTKDMKGRVAINILLGQAYFESKDYENSIDAYKGALEHSYDKDKATVYNDMGAVYNGQGDYVNAIKVLEYAIEIDPKMASPYYNLGIAYKGEDNQKKAIKAYKKAANLGDKDAQSYLKEQGLEW